MLKKKKKIGECHKINTEDLILNVGLTFSLSHCPIYANERCIVTPTMPTYICIYIHTHADERTNVKASNKALFNATYHWLLIEDYTFNRNADIDDIADNDHNDNNRSNNNESYCKRTSAQQNNESVDSDNNKSNNNADKLANKFFEPAQTHQLREKKEAKKLTAATTVATASTSITPRPKATLTAAVTADNENTMEIIEKYLEKINININTELILAKRHTRRIRAGAEAGGNEKCAATVAGDGDGVLSGRGCGTSDSGSATNNTPQRKDYYRLYDVW